MCSPPRVRTTALQTPRGLAEGPLVAQEAGLLAAPRPVTAASSWGPSGLTEPTPCPRLLAGVPPVSALGLPGGSGWVSCAAGAAWSLRGVSALLRSRLPELRAGLSVCFRTEPQSSVSPEQLLREIFCRPQKCGCFKGTCWVLIPLEGWGGKGFGDDCGPY